VETLTSGTVGRAPGNRCLYPEVLNPSNFGLISLDITGFLMLQILSIYHKLTSHRHLGK